jgi:hypothetical protein
MSDNKKYTGKIDRIRVAVGQDYEVDFFVKQYLKTKGYDMTEANEKIIRDNLAVYPKGGTIMRDELTAWLDSRFKK